MKVAPLLLVMPGKHRKCTWVFNGFSATVAVFFRGYNGTTCFFPVDHIYADSILILPDSCCLL